MYYPLQSGAVSFGSYEPWGNRIVKIFKQEHPEAILGQCWINDDRDIVDIILTFHVPIDDKIIDARMTYKITKSKSVQSDTISEPVYSPPISYNNGTWSANGVDISKYIALVPLNNPVPVMSVPMDESAIYRPSHKRIVAAINDDE